MISIPTHKITNESHNSSPFLFLINPNSGAKSAVDIPSILSKIGRSDVEILETKSAEHAKSLAQQAIAEKRKNVIAFGGDGTVNSIGSVLVGSATKLGIIPTGSGNGIARHLNISMNIEQALMQVFEQKSWAMDTFTINAKRVIGFAGVGFDGHVAKQFDTHHTRGLSAYVLLAIKAYRNYKPTSYIINDVPCTKYSVIMANTSQLGNNACINPGGQDDDGKIELIQLTKPHIASLPKSIFQLFTKSLNKSPFASFETGSQFHIKNENLAELHIDGEPFGNPSQINVAVSPKSLNVITG